MKKDLNKIFKTMPKETFKQFFDKKKEIINEKELIKEAIAIVHAEGYKVLNEGKMAKFISGLALSLGLISNTMAGEFNAHTNPTYTSKTANTSALSKQQQKDYNVENNIQMTDHIIWNIAENVCKNIINKMNKSGKYEEEDLVMMQEWENAIEFYKILKSKDPNLANMFSRRVDKLLTKSLGIAPNIQSYANQI